MSMRIGFHTAVGGNNTGIGSNYFTPLNEAGVPIILKSVGDFGICREVLELKRASGHDHVVMFRIIGCDVPNYDLPPDDSFRDHWMCVYPKLPPEYIDSEFYKSNTILQIINEVDKQRADWLGWFCLEAGQFAVANGYRFAMPSFSTGEPEKEHWETPGMLAFLDYASEHRDNVLIDLHEYSLSKDDIWYPRNDDGSPGFYHVGRFQDLLDVCDDHGIRYPLITFGEFGWESTTAPYVPEAMEHLIEVNALYDYFGDVVVGAAMWCLGPWSGDVTERVHDLIVPVKDYALQQGPPDPPSNGEPKTIKHTIHITPQDTTAEEMQALTNYLLPTRTGFTHSHDMVEAVMYHSTPDGEIHAWDDWRWPENLEEQFAWLNVNYIRRQFSEIMGGETFSFKHWPTDYEVITQVFGNNPAYYAQFGLPGHEGVDIKAPLGSLLYAVDHGEVYEVVPYDDGHSYGARVRIKHADDYKTIYAHMEEGSATVSVGDTVAPGNIIGKPDNTGNIISGSSHLHLTLKNDRAYPGGPLYIGYPYNIVDPTPFLLPYEPVFPGEPPPGSQYDLLSYLAIIGETMGPLYEVQMETWIEDNSVPGGGYWQSGPQQRHQTQQYIQIFYHTKDSEWEQLSWDNDFIYRGIDTSPGPSGGVPRFYELRDELNIPYSKWCKRFMRIGERYYRNPYVTFYNKDNCLLLSQSRHPSYLKLVAVFDSLTFSTGITLADVIVLQWQDLGGNPLEDYYYAQDYGLVGWKSHSYPQRRSAISEIHAPGARPDNQREVIDCV